MMRGRSKGSNEALASLSVCIPTWNAAARLGATLASVLAQQHAALDVVVCDDASTDATLAVARSIADPRLRVVANDQRAGLAGNWNRALAQARGDYVCLFGQDDLAGPAWASTLCGLLDRHADASLAFGRRQFVFDDEASRGLLGGFFEHRYPEMLAPFDERIAGSEVISPELMVDCAMRHDFEVNLIGEPAFVVFRRSHPAVHQGFDPAMRQMIDWEFWTRFFVDAPLVHTTRILGTYLLHAGGASVENAPLTKHYREYGHLLDVVLTRFSRMLDASQRARLLERQDRARDLARGDAEKEGRPAG
jgi:glycosyltransferase involved in cell wall biosynthesis